MAKLLYEYHEPSIITEGTGSEKKYKIGGIFSTIGQKNKNQRVYSRELWEREVKKYQDVLTSGSINRLGEWQHPERATVDPMSAVIAINKLYIEGDYVMGEATLLDNPKANQLKSLIDNGIKISVSSRGLGDVNPQGVVTDFNLITYDVVDNPSDYNATMEGFVTESVKSFDMQGNEIKAKEKSEFNEILQFIRDLK